MQSNNQQSHDMGSDAIQNDTDGGIDDTAIELYDGESSGALQSAEEQIKKLKNDLRSCREEKQSYLDGWQRAKADFANWKRREEEERKQFQKFVTEGLITDLLPILDGFHMASRNTAVWEKVDPAWRQGIEYLHKDLLRVLSGQGLEEFSPESMAFDPREHTAIETITTDDPQKDGIIAEVIQNGYRLHEKVIRPAKVKIYELRSEISPKT